MLLSFNPVFLPHANTQIPYQPGYWLLYTAAQPDVFPATPIALYNITALSFDCDAPRAWASKNAIDFVRYSPIPATFTPVPTTTPTATTSTPTATTSAASATTIAQNSQPQTSVTSSGTTSPSSLQCSQNSFPSASASAVCQNGTWIIPVSVTESNRTLIISSNTSTNINGDLTLKDVEVFVDYTNMTKAPVAITGESWHKLTRTSCKQKSHVAT